MKALKPPHRALELDRSFTLSSQLNLFPTIPEMLKRLLGLNELNKIYEEASINLRDDYFTDKLLKILNINYELSDKDFARIPSTGPVVVVSNHPFGAIEGIVLASILTSVRADVKMMANFLLKRIKELRDLMIFVDPFGNKESLKGNVRPLKEAIQWVKNGRMLAVFPAGEVAHINIKKREITDPLWSHTIGSIVRNTEASVLPVFFKGNNGPVFQLLGLIHPLLRTSLLPRELLNKRGNTIKVKIGNLISHRVITRFNGDIELVKYLRQRTYFLRHRENETSTTTIGSYFQKHKGSTSSHQLNSYLGKRCHSKSLVSLKPTLIVNPCSKSILTKELSNLSKENILIQNKDFIVINALAVDIPFLLQEIGRLREISFRGIGEGTGMSVDLDRFDKYYSHLCIWSRECNELVGAYRLCRVDEILQQFGKEGLYTNTLFNFKTQLFDLLENSLEMGRAFIEPRYQKSFLPLYWLWRGIAQYVLKHPKYKFLFGPVSISNTYNSISRQLIVDFLKVHSFMPNIAKLVQAKTPFQENILGEWKRGTNMLPVDLEELSGIISDIEPVNKDIPILLKHYLKLGGKAVGFNLDRCFSYVIDGLIILDLTKVKPKTLKRYMGYEGAENFLKYHACLEPVSELSQR